MTASVPSPPVANPAPVATYIGDEEDGPAVGVVFDLPNGDQVWSGEVSEKLLAAQPEADILGPDNGSFVVHASKGDVRILAQAATPQIAIDLATAYARSLCAAAPTPPAALEGTNEIGDDPILGPVPRQGEIRVINGRVLRFIEREIEGDKWEILGLLALDNSTPPAVSPTAKRTMTLNLTEEEMAALEEIAKAKDLSPPAVLRQALKTEQLIVRGLATVSIDGGLLAPPAVSHEGVKPGDIERVVAEADRRIAYSVNLVRLVDGDYTYRLQIDGQTLTFTDSDTPDWNAQERLYAHVAECKGRIRADAILALFSAISPQGEV